MKQNISGETIQRLRKQRGWSQKALAERMCEKGRNTTARNVSAMERGIHKVYDIDLLVLTEIFHVTVQELLKE